MKGCNIWNSKTKMVAYGQDLVFREVKYVVKQEPLPKGKEA